MLKKIAVTIAFILAVGIFYLFTQSQNVMEIRSEIDINAPSDKVWAAVTDINGWADNNSAINAASGKAAIGEMFSITMRGNEAGTDGPNYAPVITEFEDGKKLRWRAKMGAEIIFTNDKSFELIEIDGGTKLVHTEYVNGMMLPLMKSFMQNGIPPILDEMNAGFKAVAEAQ